MRHSAGDRLTEPLESVTLFIGLLLLSAVGGVVAVNLLSRTGVLPGSVCVHQPQAQYGNSGWAQSLVTARPGASVSIDGSLQACLDHPGAGQWVLYGLMLIPPVIVWTGSLFLLWRTIRMARLTGPFTVPVASVMRRLGWFILGGSAAVAVIHAAALGALLVQMTSLPSPFAFVISGAVRGVLPFPLLAGAALLTLARIMRLGAVMDEEIRATV
jgi:hypothetical protein